MTGVDIRYIRTQKGISQAKLAIIAGINQARLSAFELGKADLDINEVNLLFQKLSNLKHDEILNLKKKRIVKNLSNDSIIENLPRRGYHKTKRNTEYLDKLNTLEINFSKTSSSLKAVSFFAGCGGLCYGVKASGFQIVATNELEETYKDIYRLNFPNTNFLNNDIQQISNSEIDLLLKKHPEIDLMVGGPPCQGFSLAGKRDAKDKRNTLFEDYLKIAKQINPKVILIENVRLLTSMKDPNGEFVSKRILDTFSEIGYKSAFYNVNAMDFGVPQHRERVIFIAVRKNLNKIPSIPFPKFGEGNNLFSDLKPHFTFGDAVSDLSFLESGEKCEKDEFHWAVNHPEHVIRWLVNVPQGKSAHENEDVSLRPPSGYNTTYKRQVWDEPSGTVSTNFGMISGSRNVHPIATRALTVREALRLQSFPDSFKLTGNDGTIRTVIGNAVPPLLAFELAEYIKNNYIL